MSKITRHFLPAERAEILELLKRVAKIRQKSDPHPILSAAQDQVAHGYAYLNWSLLHRHVAKMAQPEFAVFADRVLHSDDVRKIRPARAKSERVADIKCELFSKNIGYLAEGFGDGDPQAIVLADSNRLSELMKSNDAYYYHPAKVLRHRERLRKGKFEVPLVAPEQWGVYWVEGFHQVTAALEEGMTTIPVGTSLALAQQLKSLVGVRSHGKTGHRYDLSDCIATVF
ncbi:hypothetical protein [Paraburkholderia caribensis]|uniref:hypothetical protein n=1 Tax=Paraburkholderia TaxID=1822464 RepID=UPI001CAB2D4B|nr:hypothetical protein [Paraburkholderia caribensis]BEU25565.1 hypothetical protein PBP221_57050 [Paraburkholderia sp. 22B1P]CAG9262690.1 conserved hypothetical protein [Paraburkholderia caribensis]